MRIAEQIEARLQAAFAPTAMTLVDESARHHGHLGARPGGESHFALMLESASFVGLSRLARHRRVHAALADLLADQVHALALDLRAPGDGAPG